MYIIWKKEKQALHFAGFYDGAASCANESKMKNRPVFIIMICGINQTLSVMIQKEEQAEALKYMQIPGKS